MKLVNFCKETLSSPLASIIMDRMAGLSQKRHAHSSAVAGAEHCGRQSASSRPSMAWQSVLAYWQPTKSSGILSYGCQAGPTGE